jgi:hypothetical protein
VERSAALVLYEKVVAAMAGVERKGDTMPYTSLNGHMFSVLRPKELQRFFEISRAYVGAQKPKPTTRKKGLSSKKPETRRVP